MLGGFATEQQCDAHFFLHCKFQDWAEDGG